MATGSLTAESIVRNGPRWNREWLERVAGSGHWLVVMWEVLHHRSDEFATTSCEITAEVIKWKLGGEDVEWSLLVPDDSTFAAIRQSYSCFKVTIGRDWELCDHALTVWGDYVVHSYYKQYSARVTPITDKFTAAIDWIRVQGSYQTVTETAEEAPTNANVYYWAPKGQRTIVE